ncbi:helix-turn-helix transcriptional regulator [Larkinella knui]|uniref:Helix-turn-helix domain-containing protein n=1 Tax=Larkinella knui TaxID=2025310 RepID=A0A3P1CVD1_9BACT|nr:AraC family transcriptional regulator [Larkinella knui]RRB17327.1 helix-turn-helix domain-containing protein [Larkinella knui]
MYSIKPEFEIPRYPLEQMGRLANPMLQIVEGTGQMLEHKDDILTPHRKDYYFLVYIKTGRTRHWIDMTPYTIKPQTFYFTVPHQILLKEELAPLHGTLIAFTEEFLALDDNQLLKKLPLIQNPQNGHELILSARDVEFIEETLDKITREYHQPSDWGNEMVSSYLRVLLIYLSRLYTEQFTTEDRIIDRQLVKRFQNLVEARFTELHQVADYADLMHLSAGHLSETIKVQSGKTAIEHIHERLVLEAKRLLFHSDQSVKEITAQLGFEDASYFNRFFKRLTDQTPVGYRTTIREMYH